jgi:hypothetical protein
VFESQYPVAAVLNQKFLEIRMDRTGRILYVQYTNPAGYPPLEHSSRILARKGWQVLFLGTGAFRSTRFPFPPDDRVEVRQMQFSPAGWRQELDYVRFCL